MNLSDAIVKSNFIVKAHTNKASLIEIEEGEFWIPKTQYRIHYKRLYISKWFYEEKIKGESK